MSFFKQSKIQPNNIQNKFSVIRGTMPRVGDRVMVEASYNASMPFKWNAYRIQLLPNDGAQHSSSAPQRSNGPGNWSTIDRPRERSRDRFPARRASPPRRSRKSINVHYKLYTILARRSRTPPRRNSPRRASPYHRRASPPRHAVVKRERERTPPRERESSIRTRSPTGSIARRETASPPRRRQRIIPRYTCYIPRPGVGR